MIKNICVLIPSYNEAKTIGPIVKGLKDMGLAVYVVDDGSVDDTASIAESEGAIVLRHQKNIGKGASLREGFEHILKTSFDAILTMDADDQHKTSDVDSLLRKMDQTGADMIVGNRMLNTFSMPYTRILTNHFMSSLISKMTGQYIPDSQCGFRLVKKDVLQNITLESSNYEIESEMIVKAAIKGFRIDSVPIKTVYQRQKSRISPVLDTIRFVMFLIKVALSSKGEDIG